MMVTTRAEAKAAGMKRYFTGKPCKRGHLTDRLVSGKCVECNREYIRKYRAANGAASSEYQRAYRKANAEWYANYQREYRAANPKKFRRYVGLPEPTRPAPDNCEICSAPPNGRSLHLDHCHETGRFRGWLCHNCNMALGKLGDNVEGLQRAIDYLKRNGNDPSPN